MDTMKNPNATLVPFMGLLLCVPSCYGMGQESPSWHLEFPTCSRNTYSRTTLNFIPYQFSLWDLAPHKGKGIRLVMLDTGIAGYEFEGDTQYHKHPEIQGTYNKSLGCLSVIKHNHVECTLSNTRYAVCPECLPTIRTKDVIIHRNLMHGTHAYGLIASSTYGLAPNIEIIVINIFTHEGTCNTATLIRGVEKAVSLKPDILLIGANMDENIPCNSIPARKFASLFSKIPWVIVPAGNQGCSKTYLSQPAGLDNVTLCVGAFGISYTDITPKIFVPSFSQRQPGIGPDILAPGYLITSTGVPYRHNQALSKTLSGTSASAAITAGFVALLLGEFKDKLTTQELLEIIHCATWQFDEDTDERNASKYGILDMRIALFLAHVVANDKTIKPHEVTQYLLKHHNNKMGISFLTNILETMPHKKLGNKEHKISLQSSLQNCIEQIKN